MRLRSLCGSVLVADRSAVTCGHGHDRRHQESRCQAGGHSPSPTYARKERRLCRCPPPFDEDHRKRRADETASVLPPWRDGIPAIRSKRAGGFRKAGKLGAYPAVPTLVVYFSAAHGNLLPASALTAGSFTTAAQALAGQASQGAGAPPATRGPARRHRPHHDLCLRPLVLALCDAGWSFDGRAGRRGPTRHMLRAQAQRSLARRWLCGEFNDQVALPIGWVCDVLGIEPTTLARVVRATLTRAG